MARYYVLAHGGDPDTLRPEELRGIALMLSDGLLGSKAVGSALGSIGSAIYNYLGSKISVEEMIPTLYHYIKPELTPEEKDTENSRKLLSWIMRSN